MARFMVTGGAGFAGSKATRVLGWSPKISKEQGLEETLAKALQDAPL